SDHDIKEELSLKSGTNQIELELNMFLIPGAYALNIFVTDKDSGKYYDGIWNFHQFSVSNESADGLHELGSRHNTIFHLPAKWVFNGKKLN
ncbi:MAG: hypothetical protein JKY54_10030, partial [Flavobacteriales bacterium]|nr:hypothetical protein [Flavobacteriales bacterium]